MDNFPKWIIRYRWLIIITTFVLVIGASSGLQYISFTSDNRVFFSEQSSQLQALEQLENVYSRKYNVLFIVAPHDDDIFTRDTLSAIEELTQKAWQIPYFSRVDSVSNFQHTQSSGDELVIEDLIFNAHSLFVESCA